MTPATQLRKLLDRPRCRRICRHSKCGSGCAPLSWPFLRPPEKRESLAGARTRYYPRSLMGMGHDSVVASSANRLHVAPGLSKVAENCRGNWTPGPSRTVANQACATQEGCGQLIRVKPWVRSTVSARRCSASQNSVRIVDRALACYTRASMRSVSDSRRSTERR